MYREMLYVLNRDNGMNVSMKMRSSMGVEIVNTFGPGVQQANVLKTSSIHSDNTILYEFSYSGAPGICTYIN